MTGLEERILECLDNRHAALSPDMARALNVGILQLRLALTNLSAERKVKRGGTAIDKRGVDIVVRQKYG